MRTVTALLMLTFHVVCGQLNYEGNPLTEDTVYTAEESHFAEKTAKARSLETPETEDSYLLAAKSLQAERSQNRYQSNHDETRQANRLASGNTYKTIPDDIPKENPGVQYQQRIETQDQTYAASREPLNPESSNPSESALSMFLNSKTPEESQMALEEYLFSGSKGSEASKVTQPHISDIVLPQQHLMDANQPNEIGQQDARYSPYASSQSMPSIGPLERTYIPTNRQTTRNFNTANRNVEVVGKNRPVYIHGPQSTYGRRSSAAAPPYSVSVYTAQPRISPVPIHRKISPGPYSHGGGGPEIIYTKPPGYGGKYYGGGPNGYEDASAWFPDANYPPPDVNVYRSQLYAQSYDPHYYKYIAKFGKIKPLLYGKHPKKDESFLSEVFRSFKKHGMKHVMNPMFLLGLGIPMVTLLLSAMVNSRSFARSNSGTWGDIHVTDEDINEWTTKLRKALECQQKSTSDSERNNCSAVLD